jgi:hypothetical protein
MDQLEGRSRATAERPALGSLARLPDDTLVYIPGFGEVTLGEARAVPQEPVTVPGVDSGTLAYWVAQVTQNLCREEENAA